jgi:hypothetical protein
MARKIAKRGNDVATAQRIEPITNERRETSIAFLRPRMSLALPHKGVDAVFVNMKLTTIHEISSKLPNSFDIAGMAVTIIVKSVCVKRVTKRIVLLGMLINAVDMRTTITNPNQP